MDVVYHTTVLYTTPLLYDIWPFIRVPVSVCKAAMLSDLCQDFTCEAALDLVDGPTLKLQAPW